MVSGQHLSGARGQLAAGLQTGVCTSRRPGPVVRSSVPHVQPVLAHLALVGVRFCCGGSTSHGIYSLNRAVLRAGRTPHSGAPGSFTYPPDTSNPSTRPVHFRPLHCVLPGEGPEPHSPAMFALPLGTAGLGLWASACVTRKSALDFTCTWQPKNHSLFLVVSTCSLDAVLTPGRWGAGTWNSGARGMSTGLAFDSGVDKRHWPQQGLVSRGTVRRGRVFRDGAPAGCGLCPWGGEPAGPSGPATCSLQSLSHAFLQGHTSSTLPLPCVTGKGPNLKQRIKCFSDGDGIAHLVARNLSAPKCPGQR